MEHLPEHDWKHLRVVHRAALERYCARVLANCASLIAEPGRSAHERCLALFHLVRDRNDELAGTFDDMRRSTASSFSDSQVLGPDRAAMRHFRFISLDNTVDVLTLGDTDAERVPPAV
jgi:hypothetical protein